MKEKKADITKQLPRSRKMVYVFISILLPFIFLVFLELILRASGYGDNHSLFITHPDKEYENYYVVNPEIGKKYFQKMDYSAPSKDQFLKKKPKDVFRIFVMGSSTVVGFPYNNNLMFSRILSERLHDAYPEKKIEMVNTAITAINSFTLADYIPQILEKEPDAILIYAGHNEFYGAFGVGSHEGAFHNYTLIRLHLKLMNLRVYQLLADVTGKTASLVSSDKDANRRGTLMSRIVKDADIIYGSRSYQTGIKNYEMNMSQILKLAKQKNVPVYISDLVSNLKDLKPFKSIASTDIPEAESFYKAAQKYEQQGDFLKAKENYLLARDYDCIRFRASTDISKTVIKLAEKYQAYYVPAIELFNVNSPNGIVGNNLLTEHVHPNIQGYFLLAEAFYKSIVDSKIIGNDVNTQTVKDYKYFIRNYGYTPLDSLIGVHRIANLLYHWPFRDETKGYIDYRQVYKPKDMLDSLAFNVMAKQQISLTDAHEYLAKMYFEKNDFQKAFQEYNSLTHTIPFESSNFRKAADCLLKMHDLAKALYFFERSLQLNDKNFFAHFRAGEICMIKNDFEKALVHFQKAQQYANKEEKEKALIKIYQNLVYLNRAEQGKEIASYFKNRIPVPPKVNIYKDYIPFDIKDNVVKAKLAIKSKDFQQAVELLNASLEINQAPVVYRMLGETFYQNKDYEKARSYFEKAYSEFKFDTSFLSSLFMADVVSNHIESARNTLEQLKKTNPAFPAIAQFQLMLNNPKSMIPNASSSITN